jgi:hypothetical protein
VLLLPLGRSTRPGVLQRGFLTGAETSLEDDRGAGVEAGLVCAVNPYQGLPAVVRKSMTPFGVVMSNPLDSGLASALGSLTGVGAAPASQWDRAGAPGCGPCGYRLLVSKSIPNGAGNCSLVPKGCGPSAFV